MSDQPRTPSPLSTLALLNATLRKLTSASGRIVYMRNNDGVAIPHAAIDLTTTQLMGAGRPQSMTLILDLEGLDKYSEGVIDLYEELTDEIAQHQRLVVDVDRPTPPTGS